MRFDALEEDVEARGTVELWECDEADCEDILGSFDLVWCSPAVDPIRCG